jgi:integrase
MAARRLPRPPTDPSHRRIGTPQLSDAWHDRSSTSDRIPITVLQAGLVAAGEPTKRHQPGSRGQGPKPRLDPQQVFGSPAPTDPHARGGRPPSGRLSALYRDHFLVQVGTGLRSGELLGLRRRRVFPELGRIEVIEVRYEAGRFGRGFKAEPKSLASVRVVPMCDRVRDAIHRHLRRVYKAAVEAAGAELARLDLRGPHDLRHTFATWLEDAAIPSRVIDELMATPAAAATAAPAAARWAGSTGRRPWRWWPG